ncbi:MAG: hypothetical protein V4480_03395 [Patescibacteria group bacterium]
MHDLSNKTILAHACLFDANDDGEYRKNAERTCKVAGNKSRVDIIEIDIRKSKDGVLYCYHGSLIEYYLFFHFFKKPLAYLRKRYRVNTLAAILDVIAEEKTVFLDIKDTDITREDICMDFENRRFKEVILANKSPRFLKRFHDMPQYFVKILNGNIFCDFYDLQKLRRDNFKYVEVVFPFQIRKRIQQKVQDAGMEFRCSGMFFFSNETYWRAIEKYGLKHISSDHIEDNLTY